MAGYKQSQFKNKSFAEIQKLFDKAITRVNMFIDMDTELVKESSNKDEAKMAQEIISKRAGDELEQEKAKKQKIDDDQEEAKMKKLIEVISDKESDGSLKRYSVVIHMLKNFNREDLETLWKIVKARHGYTRPEEGYERVLWGDLKTMFEHHVEDLGRIVGIKSFIRLFRITAALIKVSAAQEESYNCLFRVNVAGTKLQLLKDYNCSRIKTAEKIKIETDEDDNPDDIAEIFKIKSHLFDFKT
ncbi:hypothetical protein Tco_0589239, partial [Tanacetum coccineum]